VENMLASVNGTHTTSQGS